MNLLTLAYNAMNITLSVNDSLIILPCYSLFQASGVVLFPVDLLASSSVYCFSGIEILSVLTVISLSADFCDLWQNPNDLLKLVTEAH